MFFRIDLADVFQWYHNVSRQFGQSSSRSDAACQLTFTVDFWGANVGKR